MNQEPVRLPSIIEEGVTTNPELKRYLDDYMDRSVKKEKSEILSKNDVSGTKNTRDDTIQDSLTKKRSGGGGSRSSRKRASKTRNLRRKSIKRHRRRRTSRK